MLHWYSNKKVSIFFDKVPQVGVRYVFPSMSKEEKKSVEKYPFICKNDVKVCIKDLKKHKEYKFTIPKGYCYDGATIPRFFWRVIGPKTDNKFLLSAMVHDTLCENHGYVDDNRALSTEVLNALLESSGITPLKRFFMKNSVACFQTLMCDW